MTVLVAVLVCLVGFFSAYPAEGSVVVVEVVSGLEGKSTLIRGKSSRVQAREEKQK